MKINNSLLSVVLRGLEHRADPQHQSPEQRERQADREDDQRHRERDADHAKHVTEHTNNTTQWRLDERRTGAGARQSTAVIVHASGVERVVGRASELRSEPAGRIDGDD